MAVSNTRRRPAPVSGDTLKKEQQAVTAPAAVAPPSPPVSIPPPAPPPAVAANPGVNVPAPPPSGGLSPPAGGLGAGAIPPPAAAPIPPAGSLAEMGPITDAGAAQLDANRAAQSGAGDGNEAFNQAVADLLMGQIQGASNVDTTADEALINEQMGDQIGGALVDQRASMGRSGFGSSGAMAAMEGDLQRTARQQGLEDVLGLRRTEDQRAQDNASRAIGNDIDMRGQAEDEFFNRAMLDTLNSALGVEGAPGASGDGLWSGDPNAPGGSDGAGGGVGPTGPGTNPEEPIEQSRIPNNAQRFGQDASGRTIWAVPSGNGDGHATYYVEG